MDEPIPCPHCSAPAQITERFRLGSTTGPVEHLKTGHASEDPEGGFAHGGWTGEFMAGHRRHNSRQAVSPKVLIHRI